MFIRLTGCPLRCGYCDTEYAFSAGESMSIPTIFRKVSTYQAHYITVTGGEPLAQRACLPLLSACCDAGYSVSLETSGALAIAKVDARVLKVMDIKTPGSGEVEKNYWANLEYLSRQDELKFVLCDEVDYQWAVEIIKRERLDTICSILFSPVHGKLDPAKLAAWVLRDHLPVRMQIQLHKLLWGEGAGK